MAVINVTNSKNRTSTILMIIGVFVLVAFYGVIKVNSIEFERLVNANKQMQVVIAASQNDEAMLKLNLQEANSKGYIEKQARMKGFIMPDEECFSFSNPQMLYQTSDSEFEWIVP